MSEDSSDSVVGKLGDFSGNSSEGLLSAPWTPHAFAVSTAGPTPPKPKSPELMAAENQVKDEEKLRAQRTQFTGGGGAQGTPQTASNILMGI